MSYDVSVRVVRPVYEEVGNYTSNVGGMFQAALGFPLGMLHEQPASEAAEQLTRAVAAMEADPARYRAMEPENGWGSYGGALDYLRKFRDVCEENRDGVVRVSY